MGIGVNWNWTAISSVATLLAVLVALFPIISNAVRQRKLAKCLLVRIQTHLMLLLPTVARRLRDTEFAPYTSECFSPEEREPIDALELLFSQAHILKAKEYDKLVPLVINLRGLAYLPEFGPSRSEGVSDVLALIKESMQLFGESTILRGKGADTPWNRPAKPKKKK